LHVTRYGKASGWKRSCAAFARGPVVALLLLVPRVATAAISAGPTIDVPWLQGGEMTAAVLANGSFAIVSRKFDSEAVQAQFFRATGVPQTPPLVLIQPPAFPPAALASAGVGSLGTRYFLVWQVTKLGPDGFRAIKHAYAALYGKQGTLLGQPFLWPSSDIENFAGYYRFGSAPRWRFLPITYDFLFRGEDDITYFRPLLRVAEPSEAPQGPPVELGPPVLSNVEDAAINGSGRFVVVAYQCSSFPPPVPPCVRGMQIFHDAVTPLTPFLTADVTQVRRTVFAAIGPQGQVLLNWFTDEGRLVVRLYDQNGSPASDEMQVTTTPQGDLFSFRMKGLGDGSFILSWVREPGGDPNRGTLVVDRFDPQTKTFEEPVVIAEGPIAGALLELNGAGQGVVVWQTENTGSGPLDAKGHLRVIRVKR
jgi:hypothetical protein